MLGGYGDGAVELVGWTREGDCVSNPLETLGVPSIDGRQDGKVVRFECDDSCGAFPWATLGFRALEGILDGSLVYDGSTEDGNHETVAG